jgi:hypothetical protein
LPAFLYQRVIPARRVVAAGLLQATSLPFIVAATAIGLELRLLTPATGAALVGAGLVSVVLFPLVALALLRQSEPAVSAGPALQSAQVVTGGGTDG